MAKFATSSGVTIAVDAMGADNGPSAIIEGVAHAFKRGCQAEVIFVGDEALLRSIASGFPVLNNAKFIDAPNVVSMDDKPMHVLRRGRDTSMWTDVDTLSDGRAQAVFSGGNTGALMAVLRKQLGMIDGIDRPAITALWPTPRGRSVVLDVGANIESDEKQLVQFAILGEAFYRALTGTQEPTVGLLNVGAEDLKGHELIRKAASVLKEADGAIAFKGFVEGNDISKGTVDVVVTDGFTGNVALKAAEGAARLVGSWVGDVLKGTWNARLGSMMMFPGLRKLKERIDPSSNNGGVFLGVNGVVVKSHGSADARGVASAFAMAAELARHPFQREVSQTVKAVLGAEGGSISKFPTTDQLVKEAV